MACAVWTVGVVEGPDRGQSWRLEDIGVRRALLGHGPACDVRLTDPTASRRHAALEQDATGVHLVDLDSSGGTWLARTRVRDVYLTSGDVLRLGATTLRFETDGIPKEPLLSESTHFGEVVGQSPQMRALFPILERLAKTDLPVLVEGEAGTGKRLVAESLHRQSARGAAPFVVLDARAPAARDLLVDTAHKAQGTFFVAELGDLDADLQARLFGLVETPGGPRIVGATRRDLDREVEAGRFRDDLYQRLAATRIEVPALRRREGDIELLARKFLETPEAPVPDDLLARLRAYAWPGNVAELKSALTSGARAPASSQTDYLRSVVTSGMSYPLARDKVVEEFTRRYVEYMLSQHGGNVTRAAAASGIGRRYFQMVRGKTA